MTISSVRQITLLCAVPLLAIMLGAANKFATPATAAPDETPSRPASTFEARASAAGLSSSQAQALRHRVAQEIRRTGGHQVALNQVEWPGGDTLFPLPGDRHARELTGSEAPTLVTTNATINGCSYYYLCLYQWRDFSGAIYRYKQCGMYSTPYYFSSYVNDQTSGTRGRFYDAHKGFLSYTYPAFYAGTTSLGYMTWYIRPC